MVRKIDKELVEEILSAVSKQEKTGYEIYKEIRKKGRNVSSRMVYHYLYAALKEGKVSVETKNELGKFSWGSTASKKYYKIR
jgi:DNA-binding PadR family transcriptional regulator